MQITSRYSENEGRKAAEKASLRYVNDGIPGIRRRKYGKGFAYYSPDGGHIENDDVLTRIKKLAIPPAYRKVWICPYDDGHLQATGRDSMLRKQYRYHPEWQAVRDAAKFGHVGTLMEALPGVMQQVESDLQQTGLPRSRVLAAIVHIMCNHYVRVGNIIYAKTHRTFGLTTLRKKHLKRERKNLVLDFKGKNGTPWRVVLKDRKVGRVLEECGDLRGYELFKYRDEEKKVNCVHSNDVNAYLHEISGLPVTAKDFRTLAACRELYHQLAAEPPCEVKRKKAKQLNSCIAHVAKKLGHTPAVCRKSYLHPEIITQWEQGMLKGEASKEPDAFKRWWNENATGA